jgi:PPOX class probable F420-dependent enzyme
MNELPEAVRDLLDGPNYAHIATVLPDGSPHSVPVWIGLEDGRIAFLTGPGSRKARNLDRDPRVAISITARDNPFTMAVIRGRMAERIEDDRAWTIIDRISRKYTGQPYPLRTGRVVFLIDNEHAQASTFG